LPTFCLWTKRAEKALKKLLKKLKKEGTIMVDGGRYRLAQEEVVAGTVLANPNGFGFLEVGEGKKDIYIPPFEMERLLHGDRVKAKVVEFKGKKEIRVLKVLKRGTRELVCSIKKEKGQCVGVPLDPEQLSQGLFAKGCLQRVKGRHRNISGNCAIPFQRKPNVGQS
jgi:ribonuclease R